jgi:hypothetical protein
MLQPSPGNTFGLGQVANFRDIAGMDGAPMVLPGGQLKRGVLFRTSMLTMATEADRECITSRCKTYIDLRTPGNPPESLDSDIFEHFSPSPLRSGQHQQHREPGQPRRISLAIGKGFFPDGNESVVDIHPKDADGKLVPMSLMTKEQHASFLIGYNKAALTINKELVAKAMKELANQKNYPMLFGCMTGKDRTGLIACLVLGVLGASNEQILADYMLSDLAADDNTAVIQLMFKELKRLFESGQAPAGMQLLGGPLFAGPAQNQPKQRKSSFMGARVHEVVMQETLDYIKSEHGGIVAYLRSIGLTSADLQQMRDILMEPRAASRL